MWKQVYFPGGFILLAVVALQLWTPARAKIEPFLFFFYFAILAVTLVLGALYNRGRTVLASLAIAMAAVAVVASRLGGAPVAPQLQLLVLWLPATLFLCALLREQGLRAPAILAAGGFIAAQAACFPLLSRFASTRVEEILTIHLIPSAWVRWSTLTQPALVVFAVTMVVLAFLFYWKCRPTDRALLWASASVFLALHAVHDATLAMLFFSGAVLILAVGVLEHAHSVAYLDELTGIPGRRALNEFLPQVLGRVTVAMVDVDHFKKFNDTYGHDAGDQVLRLVARRLAAVKGGGRVFRYGGEEFTIVFPGLSQKEATPYLEAVRAGIEDPGFYLRGAHRPKRKPRERRIFPRGGKTVRVTVSIGAAERNADTSRPVEILGAADRALYRAKEAGRNQVCLAA